jgi:uncharacterized DUF497 family protein
MIFEWDVKKAEINFEKHAVRFSETLAVFEDEYAITIEDNESDPGEQRFLSIGPAAWHECLSLFIASGRVCTGYIGAPGNGPGAKTIRGKAMKKEYDFSRGKRGRIAPPEPNNAARHASRFESMKMCWIIS